MTLKDLKQFFEELPKDEHISFSLSHPFSWRGSYDEVAFSIDLDTYSLPSHNLEMIDEAITGTYQGWKGGNYSYDLDTDVNFEESEGRWSNNGYVLNIMFKALLNL